MTESQVLKLVLRKLDTLILSKDIIWHSRLNSGKVNSGVYWIKLCEIGTPDVIAIVNCHNGKIAILFIEVKRTGIKRLRYEQTQFFNNMEGKPMILCVIINDVKQVYPAVRRAKNL